MSSESKKQINEIIESMMDFESEFTDIENNK